MSEEPTGKGNDGGVLSRIFSAGNKEATGSTATPASGGAARPTLDEVAAAAEGAGAVGAGVAPKKRGPKGPWKNKRPVEAGDGAEEIPADFQEFWTEKEIGWIVDAPALTAQVYFGPEHEHWEKTLEGLKATHAKLSWLANYYQVRHPAKFILALTAAQIVGLYGVALIKSRMIESAKAEAAKAEAAKAAK